MARRRKPRSGGGPTPLAKFLLAAVVVGSIFGGVMYAKNNGMLDSVIAEAEGKVSEKETAKAAKKASKEVTKVVLSPFGGYAGGPYFNNGFKPNKESRFESEYGVKVEFVVEADQEKSMKMWTNDEIDLHWFTVGAMSTVYNSLAAHSPVFIFQSDWSRGGDAIVAMAGINNVAQLKGKKIAFVPNSPSHTAVLGLLKANNMSVTDIVPVHVSTPFEAADKFNQGYVHAAAVWAPDDVKCLRTKAGSKVLVSTKQLTHIIADGFFVKKDKYDANPEKYNKIAEGWIRGNGEINSSSSNKAKAASILAAGFGDGSASDYTSAINNVRLTSYGDNKNFFGFNPVFSGVNGNKLYTNVAKMYNKNGIDVGGSWSIVSSASAIQSMDATKFTNIGDKAEQKQTFQKVSVVKAKKATSFAKSTVKVRFPSGSSQLTEAAMSVLDMKLLPTLEEFGSVQIRLEGNTDSDGDNGMNRILSQKRAQSIVNYFVNTYDMDSNRFIVIGNGEDNPVATNATAAGRAKNRRVEAFLLQ